MDTSYDAPVEPQQDHLEVSTPNNNLLQIPADPMSTERPQAADSSPSSLKNYRFKHGSSIATPSHRGGPDNLSQEPNTPQYGGPEQNDPDAVLMPDMRRLKRDIQENLNALRTSKKLPAINHDIVASLIAEDYAEFLKTNDHDKELFDQLCEDYTNLGEVKIVYGFTNFENEGEIPDNLYDEVLDLGNVIFEGQEDREVLLNPEINHVGIGIAVNENKIAVVALLSAKMVTLTSMKEADQGIELSGKMLVDTHGVYAIRVQKHDTKKELVLVGPENIEFNMKTKEFKAFVPLEDGLEGHLKVVELYARRKPETIEYKAARKEKINLNHLEIALRYPCVTYPQPRELEEDREDKARKEQKKLQTDKNESLKKKQKEQEAWERKEIRRKVFDMIAAGEDNPENLNMSPPGNRRRKRWLEEIGNQNKSPFAKMAKQQQQQQGQDLDGEEDEEEGAEQEYEDEENYGEEEGEHEEEQEGSEGEQEDEEDEEGEKSDKQSKQSKQSKEKSPVVPETTRISHELGMALEEADNELTRLEDRNLFLQRLVCEMRDKRDLQLDRQTEVGMTEGKYLNTLAHVHQIRQELRNTQDRYNAMARELQGKLEEKQQSCFEIRRAFKGLMREVSKNSIYTKTDKPFGEKRVDEWEVREDLKSQELQALRLENIRLRNQLANNQKTMKKKEELADGLHLIDYEQLKIENQTLCEKIEERNEDLHRMKKNNANVVQVLTHIREKLQFEIKMNEKLNKDNDTLGQEVFTTRSKVSELKKEKQKYKYQNEEIKQQTGIMTNKHLRTDFEKTLNEIRTEGGKLKYLEARFAYMSSVMQEATRKNKWKKFLGSPMGSPVKSTSFGSPMKSTTFGSPMRSPIKS